MSLSTSKNAIVVRSVSGPANALVHGTCELTELGVFGQVENCSVTNVSEQKEFLDCLGNLRELLLTNPAFELEFDVIFDADVEPPAIGDTISFPYIGVTGIVLPGTQIKWAKQEARMMSIKAKSWNSLDVSTGGNAGIFSYNGEDYTQTGGAE